MATSMPQIKKNGKQAEAAASQAIATQSDASWAFFLFIERNRAAVLASPFCLAAVMIVLNLFAGQRVHEVIQFLTGVTPK